MSKQILDILFDSKNRVRILKFLFHNMDRGHTVKEIAKHTQESTSNIKREMKKFKEIGLVREITRRSSKK